jgi:mono/diheme cytochrome c family protein
MGIFRVNNWRRPHLLLIVLLSGWSAPGWGQETAAGTRLFHQYCASCHGETGNGNGPVAPYLNVKPSDLTTITDRHQGTFPEEQITRIIAGEENPLGHGTRTMPVWGERLQDDVIGTVNKATIARGRIGFLVDYVRELQGSSRKSFDNVVIPEQSPRIGGQPIR